MDSSASYEISSSAAEFLEKEKLCKVSMIFIYRVYNLLHIYSTFLMYFIYNAGITSSR